MASAPQVQQRVGHHLAGAVVGDLAAAVGAHHGDVAGAEHVFVAPGHALREHRRVLDQPEFVVGLGAARGGEGAHGCFGLGVVAPAQGQDTHGTSLDRAASRRVNAYRRPTMTLLARWICVAALLAPPAFAAPALSEAVQEALDRAVVAYESGRHAEARTAFEALALRGVPAAQYNLAVMHLRDELPQPDRALARRLLTRAAEGGFVTAQFMLGQALENGEFGARDLALAHRWYEVAATGGSVDAQVAMGTGHYLGRGLKKDAAQAAHWFREAAKGGDVGAQYLLASMYEQGDGVERDLRLARYWYDDRGQQRRRGGAGQAAAAGHAARPCALGAGPLAGQSTTFTIGWLLSALYSASSCARLVAVTVSVRPR